MLYSFGGLMSIIIISIIIVTVPILTNASLKNNVTASPMYGLSISAIPIPITNDAPVIPITLITMFPMRIAMGEVLDRV